MPQVEHLSPRPTPSAPRAPLAARTRLSDYQRPPFCADEVRLDINLGETETVIRSRLLIRRNTPQPVPLRLDGVGLVLLSVSIDGRRLGPDEYILEPQALVIRAVPSSFTFECEVRLNPSRNEALIGLYLSNGGFYTQCEPEGFRRITYLPDRPDFLARYTVRIEADQSRFPHLLANGERLEQGTAAKGRHYAVWHDPFPKPSYLFALVAGAFDVLEDRLTTMHGRSVCLRIFTDRGSADRATYAMNALKRAMRWDEGAYGREYDLDLFMIVAVRHFNFGAMENKGLNLFSSGLLLADPAVATDQDYARIERLIAHEYFHNWTGNRITCRDWLQLCLKEGLTVFREQEFCADQHGAALERTRRVEVLRTRQFTEDAGAFAHPVRPSSVAEIDNLYTATVYEKGAELVRLLHSMVGPRAFRQGMDLYFRRCDGTAATVEDFLACHAEASSRDLAKLLVWYGQSGTPIVEVVPCYDAQRRVLTLKCSQHTPSAFGESGGAPLLIPMRIGLLDEQGAPQTFRDQAGAAPVEEALIVLEETANTVELFDVGRAPVLSLFRGFSAPVLFSIDEPPDHALTRFEFDGDLFNRWEAAQQLSSRFILGRLAGVTDLDGERRLALAMSSALQDTALDPAFKARLLELPSARELSRAARPLDPTALQLARNAVKLGIARRLAPQLETFICAEPPRPAGGGDSGSAGWRALKNAALDLLVTADGTTACVRAKAHYETADNMTDAIAGLTALSHCDEEFYRQALKDFYRKWRHEPLAIDKWFAVQAAAAGGDGIGHVIELSHHPDFDARNPDRMRSLVATFTQENPAAFHDPSGLGYRFLAEQILAIDAFNPIVAAQLMEPFAVWRHCTAQLAALMHEQLRRIAAAKLVSNNVLERARAALRSSGPEGVTP